MNITLNLNPDGSVTWVQAQPTQPVVTPPVQQPIPQPAPQPLPYVPTPAPVIGSGDYVMPVTSQLWPIPPCIGGGEGGCAVQFVADSVAYPLGMVLKFVDETKPSMTKDYVVSATPHNFNSELTGRTSALGMGATGVLVFRYGQGSFDPNQDCQLTPGGTYYINFRDHDPARGTVQSQFVQQPRTDP